MPTIKPSASRVAARFLQARPMLPADLAKVVTDEVEEALDDLATSYEAHAHRTVEIGGRGYRFGSGSDGGLGGEAYTTLQHMSSTGGWPKDSALSKMLTDAEAKAYEYADNEWINQNLEFLNENGIAPADVGYNELYEAGFGAEAEDLNEFEYDAMSEENVTFRIGAFYYGPENRLEGKLGEHNMYVFSVMEYEGHFGASKTYPIAEMTFAFDGTGADLRPKLKKALAKVVSAAE